MKKQSIYLSLGSNLGDRAVNLRNAIGQLPDAGVRVLRESSVYETEPVDFLEQPWFLNCAVKGETQLKPLELLPALRGIEERMGSKKEFAKGPRLIDLDVLLYGEEIIENSAMQIPHPRMHLRRFVLEPLAEIAPAIHHPLLMLTVAELRANLADRSQVRQLPGNG